jgi:predicted Rossmann-fold nucleotide-binding protein
LTWAQLRFHAKPIGMLNIDGYFDALLSFLDQSVSTGFLSQRNRQLLLDATTPELLIDRLLNAS